LLGILSRMRKKGWVIKSYHLKKYVAVVHRVS
jgi:hypothetical protein